jgi:hypothetical protein
MKLDSLLVHAKLVHLLINFALYDKLFGSRSRYRRKYLKRKSSARSGGGGGYAQYGRHWWFWTHAGRKTWRKCQKKGKDSGYWKKHKCSSRPKVEKGSKWWWWTRSGRRAWKQCKKEGKKSAFWKENNCSAGR